MKKIDTNFNMNVSEGEDRFTKNYMISVESRRGNYHIATAVFDKTDNILNQEAMKELSVKFTELIMEEILKEKCSKKDLNHTADIIPFKKMHCKLDTVQ